MKKNAALEKASSFLDYSLDLIYKAILMVNKIILVIMVFVIFYTVFGRYVLHSTPSWGEEVGTFCMVWIALLSSSLAVRDGRHIRMTIVEYFLPKKAAKYLYKFLHIFILLIGLVFLFAGTSLTKLLSGSILTATKISAGWLSLSIPVSGLLIILMLIARFRRAQW